MTNAPKPPSILPRAEIAWGDGALRSPVHDDVYFSGDGEGESAHVFLAGNALAERFASAGRFAIGELGFGTGLNFLLAWRLWKETQKPAGARLDFLSAEAFPLSPGDMARAHAAWPALAQFSARLRAVLPPPVAGLHRLDIADDVSLTLAYGEAGAALARLEGGVDAWFFDGFSPAKNPAMWTPEIFADAARLSKPGATFATFTVAGAVRRALSGAGFRPEKRPGYGRKKEMLAGVIDASPRHSRRAPWFETANMTPLAPGARIAVIGGGIAGASLAFAARRAGLAPVIVERRGLAAGASGNPGGLVMPRLDLGGGPAARFFLAAYLYTVRLLNDIPASDDAALFNACGVLLGAKDAAERERQAKILVEDILPPDWLDARADGLFFPQGGVVDPARFVAALAGDAPVIRKTAIATRPEGARRRVFFSDGGNEIFDAVILANGVEALGFLDARTLPLSGVAGQIDWFPDAHAPPHALACGPYAAPAPGGGLLIGATYDRLAPGAAPSPTRAASDANIAALAGFAPDLAAGLDAGAARARASLRCQTPDRLPVAGPLFDPGFYGGAYDGVRTGERRDYPPGEMATGAWILAGLGSRGLVTAPLCAAMIVAEMTDGPAPVDHEIAEALHPARFFMRELKRARTIRKG